MSTRCITAGKYGYVPSIILNCRRCFLFLTHKCFPTKLHQKRPVSSILQINSSKISSSSTIIFLNSSMNSSGLAFSHKMGLVMGIFFYHLCRNHSNRMASKSAEKSCHKFFSDLQTLFKMYSNVIFFLNC